MAAFDRDLSVTLVRRDDDIGEKEGQPLEQHEQVPEEPAAVEFRFVELRIDIVVVEDVLLSEQLERQGDQEN